MSPPILRWDRANGRFRNAAGQFIAPSDVRAALDKDLAGLTEDVGALADDLRSGRLSLDGWRQAMRDLIKHVHMGSAALATGGRAQMTNADWGRAGQIIRGQYQYLEEWVAEINAGWILDGRLQSRARLYMQQGRTTYQTVQAVEMDARGFDEVRSVLHPAEHCGECLAQAAIGWQPIGQMIPIGQRQCLSNDRCAVEYRNSTTGRVFALAA